MHIENLLVIVEKGISFDPKVEEFEARQTY